MSCTHKIGGLHVCKHQKISNALTKRKTKGVCKRASERARESVYVCSRKICLSSFVLMSFFHSFLLYFSVEKAIPSKNTSHKYVCTHTMFYAVQIHDAPYQLIKGIAHIVSQTSTHTYACMVYTDNPVSGSIYSAHIC